MTPEDFALDQELRDVKTRPITEQVLYLKLRLAEASLGLAAKHAAARTWDGCMHEMSTAAEAIAEAGNAWSEIGPEQALVARIARARHGRKSGAKKARVR